MQVEIVVGKGTKQRSGRALIDGIGRRLADRRRALGWTQAVLAEKIGVAEETMSRMESGRVAISLERLARFCDLLDLSIEELLLQVSENPGDEARALIKSLEDLPLAERHIVLDNARNLAALLRKSKNKRQH
ncbi:TPA: helix-turn-helix transcriptional regulator [Burkholderia vietnamiensis]|nr:XRE family transcriptional regulator [Burkholderia vietnamiensis]MBR8014085.1 helix-turn-helix transcriptional regulator [Burkholderia vietnamiensis]HDR9040828.1 helix-turn-helix transcriptional regulator [Burkholderia vietnamiensis]HDR9168709.1 helix-turn-helix transcriptional regulator [Burkholderia vietnamiensis]HDR9195828.1 helix-turn-helix transcriptional regulator [Burkholderia vietnamiensis]